jgi:hypothetical protein
MNVKSFEQSKMLNFENNSVFSNTAERTLNITVSNMQFTDSDMPLVMGCGRKARMGDWVICTDQRT